MPTPRRELVDPIQPLFYHLISRCVRRSWLCGYDHYTRRDFSHRKQWLIKRMKFLAQFFAIELHAYSVMSNHFHLVVYYDPLASMRWTDEEVVDRWLSVCPPRSYRDDPDESTLFLHKQLLLGDSARLLHLRAELGSLSTYMKMLKQPIARRANQEDDVTGHFFEQRFYSGALLSERSVQAAMAYVDLNAVEALIATSIEQIEDASITERLAALESDPATLDAYLAPLVSGLGEKSQKVFISLRAYIEVMKLGCDRRVQYHESSPEARWLQDISTLGHLQRAYGPRALLERWKDERQWRQPGRPVSE